MKPVKIVQHRGDNLNAPENTLAAAQRAVLSGADYIEFDVRQSRDGILYVLHDETVDRTTNGRGAIADLTSQEIDGLDAGSWFAPDFAGEPVPRLDVFLASIKGLCKIYCEIKQADVNDVVKALRRFGPAEDMFFGSFSAEIRQTFREAAPDIRRNVQRFIAGSLENAIHREHAHIFEFMEDEVSQDAVEEAKSRGLETMVFIDSPNAELFADLVTWQVDYVNLDHAALFRAVQQELLLAAG
ncbi:glycerophosphodiester phosphodiesterase family protein [Thalassospira sp. MA62]|nr:glycerophosphodiester phosphodiesterase family protein [Thalassospira sp. MA62]